MTDYFHDSVPDGLSIAINGYDESIQCCEEDGDELLVMTFGKGVCGNDLEAASDKDIKKFATSMKDYFELSYLPEADDVKEIINKACVVGRMSQEF